MQAPPRGKQVFLALWIAVTVIKVIIAARLPLFVDEAFYWQEGQHLAAAYSDLPGLTAWLIRLGVEMFGPHVLSVRLPFLLMAALLPWLIAHISARWFGEAIGWQAGTVVLVMPLSGTLGILALPDVPMAFATVLCLDAGARLLRSVDASSAAELALGLAIGALSHYRFVGVIGVGLIALLLLPEGRRLLADARVWVALAVGIVAWAPLVAWNLEYADAGLRFQLVDRHPWSFQASGAWFVLVQALLVTPLLFVALVQVFMRAFDRNSQMPAQWRYFGILGGVSTVGFFVLGFFADVERVSFHWTLPGYLALIVALPLLLQQWHRGWRIAAWTMAAVGLVLALGFYAMTASSSAREHLSGSKYYPYNFAGWEQLAAAVRAEQARLGPDSKLIAGSFKIGAELGFMLDDADIPVLDHPLNHKHGRAPQLDLWKLHVSSAPATPALIVLGPDEVKLRQLLPYYQQLCQTLGTLKLLRTVDVDHGSSRFLLLSYTPAAERTPAAGDDGACITPAVAYMDHALQREGGSPTLRVNGWAAKDGAGIDKVEILLNGNSAGTITYGINAQSTLQDFLQRRSRDPHQPSIGFSGQLPADKLKPGVNWLGLRLHGADGSVEDWNEQRLIVEP
ncbi:ArnT family glycosyltransferase [Pseudoxanthomonas dokdonensis]|uniref:Membrane protein n=1 Tax=Pseudoxanthomonas dokdonensis TaxID=344882 RepID=A0A0R0CYC0_9GAMM|nr:glycosyltransferase family 39 protein [Pseudoxanthomonas dokdonensis]KRG70849.1 membrane protein [Pseudoxanthomonas dokdonensis]